MGSGFPVTNKTMGMRRYWVDLKMNVEHRTSNVEHRIMMSLRSAILFHLFSKLRCQTFLVPTVPRGNPYRSAFPWGTMGTRRKRNQPFFKIIHLLRHICFQS